MNLYTRSYVSTVFLRACKKVLSKTMFVGTCIYVHVTESPVRMYLLDLNMALVQFPSSFPLSHTVPNKEKKRDVLQLWLPCYLKRSCFVAPVAVEQTRIYGQDEEAREVKRTAACPPALWLCTPPAVWHGCVWTERLTILRLCLPTNDTCVTNQYNPTYQSS